MTLCLAAAAMAAGTAACGSSSSSGGSSGKSDGSTSGKAPLKIFLDYPSNNQISPFGAMLPASQAAVAAINKSGGVQGHPLQLLSCNNLSAQGQALTCVRNGIQDKPVAFVGESDLFTTQDMPLLQSAGIPSVGLYSFGNPIDSTSPNSFPINGGSVGAYLGTPAMLKELGYTSFSVETCSLPSCQQQAKLLAEVAPKAGVKDLGSITSPISGVTDYSSYAKKQQALKAPVVVQITGPAEGVGLITSGRSLGYSPQYVGNDQMIGESSGGQKVYQDFMMAGPFPAPRSQNIPAMKEYVKELAAYAHETPATYLSKTQFNVSWSAALNAWLAVHAFADAADKIKGPITASSMLAFLKSDKTPISLYGLETWTPGASGPKDYPRFASMENYMTEMDKGKLVTSQKAKPVNVLSAIGS